MSNIVERARSISEFESREARWVIPYWIPKGAITLLAGSGGIGKTNLWCYILSCISCVRPSMLYDTEIGFDPNKLEEEKEPFSEEEQATMKAVVEAAGGTLEVSPPAGKISLTED